MGYYVKFESKKICLRKDIPEWLIQFFLDTDVSKVENPDHALFKTDRCSSLFCNHSVIRPYLFRKGNNGYYELSLYCEIKYGWDEIRAFADWITPFVAGHKKKEYIGWMQGEGRNYRENIYIERL